MTKLSSIDHIWTARKGELQARNRWASRDTGYLYVWASGISTFKIAVPDIQVIFYLLFMHFSVINEGNK